MGVDAVMFVRHKGMYSPREVRRISADLAAAFWHEPFMVRRPGESAWRPQGVHALEIFAGPEDEEGDDLYGMTPKAGEQVIEVNLYGRYYGPGYERGDWPQLYAIARWLKARIPDCSVWYGGDSRNSLEEMTDAFNDAMWLHFTSVGHEPYIERDSPYGPRITKPVCGFCGNRPMWNQMGGPSGDGFTCEGCGHRVRQVTKGATEYVEVDKNWEPLPQKGKA